MDKLIIASGYFDPLHKGHVEYLNKAKKLGDKLIVIINNDKQVKLKGSKVFQDENERRLIINNLKSVDMVFKSIDSDRTVIQSIKFIWLLYNGLYELVFTNGGDVIKCAENEICQKLGIECVYNLGNKIQSSSLLKGENKSL